MIFVKKIPKTKENSLSVSQAKIVVWLNDNVIIGIVYIIMMLLWQFVIWGKFLIKIVEIIPLSLFCRIANKRLGSFEENLEAFQKPFPPSCQSLPLFLKSQIVT